MKNLCQNSRSLGVDFNAGSPEYKVGVLTTGLADMLITIVNFLTMAVK
jgi:hypothetical protein